MKNILFYNRKGQRESQINIYHNFLLGLVNDNQSNSDIDFARLVASKNLN